LCEEFSIQQSRTWLLPVQVCCASMAKNKGKSYLGKAKQLATGKSKLKVGKNAKERHGQVGVLLGHLAG
jgi:hypothetical protein